jgi:hypothetical protein
MNTVTAAAFPLGRDPTHGDRSCFAVIHRISSRAGIAAAVTEFATPAIPAVAFRAFGEVRPLLNRYVLPVYAGPGMPLREIICDRICRILLHFSALFSSAISQPTEIDPCSETAQILLAYRG